MAQRMNHSYISVSQLVEKLKTNGYIDDNTDYIRVEFDDWDKVDCKYGSFVNVKVLALFTETREGMNRSRPIDYVHICEIGGIHLWLNVGKKFNLDCKYWSSTRRSLKTIDIFLKSRKEFVAKDGTIRAYYDMYERILADPKDKELHRLQKLRAEGEKEYINNLCTKCNVETDEESEDDDIYLN